jgi:hypothetical protein
MTRFARERHEYRVLAWSDGSDLSGLGKGPWRHKRAQAHADVLDFFEYEHVVVQKVRMGITKILETETIR